MRKKGRRRNNEGGKGKGKIKGEEKGFDGPMSNCFLRTGKCQFIQTIQWKPTDGQTATTDGVVALTSTPLRGWQVGNRSTANPQLIEIDT